MLKNTESGNLPENDAVGPDVRLSGELSVSQTLQCHPLEGQSSSTELDVGFSLSREAKVRYLEDPLVPHQNVPAGEVAMNHPQPSEELL